MNQFIVSAKARHDVLSVVYKAMDGNMLTDPNQLIAIRAGMYAIKIIIQDMEAIEKSGTN